MKLHLSKVPALLLALLLQFAPVLKVLQSSSALASSPLAIVIKFAAAAAVALGGHHAVSGASTVLITSTNASVGTNGTAYAYTITTSDQHTNSGHFCAASNLPPNLIVTLFEGGFPAFGRITGTPTNFGIWTVGLTFTYAGASAVPTNMTLTVYSKPIITNQPVGVTNTAGANASFSVVAGALPPPTYRWRLGNATLPNQTNATLNLTNIGPGEVGNYTVVLSNFVGSVTSSVANLALGSPGSGPGIVTQPHDATVLVGGSTNFSCVATGSPSPSFFWRKNGSPIAGGANGTNTLSNVTTNDAGNYTVVVSNSVNSVTSQVAVLNVVRLPSLLPIDKSNNVVRMQFTRDAGASYQVQYTPKVPTNTWQTLTNFPAQAQATNTLVTDPFTNGPARFYQLRLTIP